MIKRREFLKAAGLSAAAMGRSRVLSAAQSGPSASVPGATEYPKLAIKTRYSPQRLAFAAWAGYEGVVVDVDDFFDPDKLSDNQIDQILSTARDAGVRIISIAGFSLCTPRTRKSSNRFSRKSASMAKAGGVTAFPARG